MAAWAALCLEPTMCRRKCAEGLRSMRFAETTALAILADEAKTKPLLKRAVLGLALWQHAWVDRHLAKVSGSHETRIGE